MMMRLFLYAAVFRLQLDFCTVGKINVFSLLHDHDQSYWHWAFATLSKLCYLYGERTASDTEGKK